MNEEWVWIVAAGTLQIPLIKEAKKRGYKVLVSDGNPDAVGTREADASLNIDTYDIDAHVSVALSIARKKAIRAVLTAGADVGPTVSAIAETLGLPAESLAVAQTVRNKHSFRKAFKQSHPIFLDVSPKEDAPGSRWKNICSMNGIKPYPCIVKPLESSATRGVTLVESPWKLKDAIKAASRHSKTRHSNVLIEEYINGDMEVALDYFVFDGELFFANGACRIFRHKNSQGFEIGHINPWKPPRIIGRIVKQAISDIGVTFGPFKVDLIHDERGWFILEAATRLSGGFDHMYTCPIATGKDVTGVMLDMALGLGVNKGKLTATKPGFACAYSPILAPGKVKEWHLQKAKDSDGVQEIFVTKQDEIPVLEHCANRPVFVLTKDKTSMGAFRKAVKAGKLIEVEYL